MPPFVNTRAAQAVKAALLQAYGRPEAVTDALVESLLCPARQPGAPAVFLDVVCNSGGPLPEEQLQVRRPEKGSGV